MQVLTWSPAAMRPVLCAMLTVGGATYGDLSATEQGMLSGALEHIFHHQIDLDTLEPITPADLAQVGLSPDQRSLATQLLVLMPYAPGEIDPLAVKRVDEFAAALGTHPDTLQDLHRLRDRQVNRLAWDYGRRTLKAFATGQHQGPFKAVWQAIREYVGEAHIAKQYQALEQLPEGTLGREFFEFYRSRNFPLPGEKHSLSQLLVNHDCTHILTGCNTDLQGELDVAAVEAGMSQTGIGFENVMEIMIVAQLGYSFMNNFGIPATKGALQPDRFFHYLELGSKLNCDLITDLDFWAEAENSLVDLRQKLGIEGVTGERMPVPTDA